MVAGDGAVVVVGVGAPGAVVEVVPWARSKRLLELLAEVVLGSRLVDPGAPELVRHEQQQQGAHGHQDTTDGPEHPAHGRRG